MENLEALTQQALDAVAASSDMAALDQVRVQYLGKKGEISALMKKPGQCCSGRSPESRRGD